MKVCENTTQDQAISSKVPISNDLDARGSHLEAMMNRLEKKMEAMMSKNEKIVKSYAQAAQVGTVSTTPVLGNNTRGVQKVTTLERQTVHILDEYADR